MFTLAERFADLINGTIVHVEGDHVVFWTGGRVLLRYQIVEGGLSEAGSHWSSEAINGLSEAIELARSVTFL